MNKHPIKGKLPPAKGQIKRAWGEVGGSGLTKVKGSDELAGDTALVLEISGDSLVKAKGPGSPAGDTTVLEITRNSPAKARRPADKPVGSVEKKAGGAQKAVKKGLDRQRSKTKPKSKSQ